MADEYVTCKDSMKLGLKSLVIKNEVKVTSPNAIFVSMWGGISPIKPMNLKNSDQENFIIT